jgi:hypothetical protein
MWFEDRELGGTVIATLVAIPYVVEILLQLPLLTRLMRALPDEQRAKLPPHPRRPWLAVFGSARFFIALFRLALRDGASDGRELLALKRRARASALREALFGIAFWATVVVLWRQGWRPPWPS